MTEAVFKIDTSAIMREAQDKVLSAVETMVRDPAWVAQIERVINQTINRVVLERSGAIDLVDHINQRVDKNFNIERETFTGIIDQSTQPQFTITDTGTELTNALTTNSLRTTDAVITNLAVTGSINTDNPSWLALAESISEKTLSALGPSWQEKLTKQVAEHISTKGVDFTDVKLDGKPIFDGKRLNESITESNLQKVGALRGLKVLGETHLNDTVVVVNSRVGINTDTPEMALSIWDEEIAINVGKYKSGQAYIGTSRPQAVSIGVNRIPQIEINEEGLTTIKKLKLGLHLISHSAEVPGWAGTRGDFVFNTNPKDDKIFAWTCLGGTKWQALKSA